MERDAEPDFEVPGRIKRATEQLAEQEKGHKVRDSCVVDLCFTQLTIFECACSRMHTLKNTQWQSPCTWSAWHQSTTCTMSLAECTTGTTTLTTYIHLPTVVPCAVSWTDHLSCLSNNLQLSGTNGHEPAKYVALEPSGFVALFDDHPRSPCTYPETHL